ncbi:MAG TPA: enoyl-CoA hydratase/isomerase family protein [Acidimicrobiaceae bacterium]|jgi:enoyl-CoA hydratase/carnithine racemase|nr:enoyl-CoA hydratase/isomerase family protein [Acidimicrobiaceae bacterium]HAZ56296.1 enoyl-CoA hydratase/isomerase family protein [Acidimicrobiaceae bacterium]HIE66749.1 enoyl-CoA hydratase/isomerase family protein [Acidimicrobiia bacterium]|tara:strand:- start:3794 stop:4597 length:804 start_codon:yes stop_codon:yes gene_type:complete
MSTPPDFQTIKVTCDGRRGTLTLNRPDRLNALSNELMAEVAEAASWFDHQSNLRVVVVSGEGRAFSAGFDLSVFGDDGPSPAGGRVPADTGRLMADALERTSPVLIAALHGHVVGGGLVVAAACDLRIATDDVSFSIPEVDLGIPLAWGGIPRLVREIGPALTKELVMTCRPFGAEEAMAAGFLNRIVPADDLDTAVDELAEAVASRPRAAVLATKRHVNAVTDQMVGTGRSWSDADGLTAALRDPEGRASREAYLERMQARKKDRG